MHPIVVGLSLVGDILVHILLHLLQFVGIHGLGHTVDFLVHDVEYLSCQLGFERTVGNDSCHILEVVLRSLGNSSTAICCTGILADSLKIDHTENLSGDRGTH